MARMVELIREGKVPASMLRRAAQGGLSLPAEEAVEILVALTSHREFGATAEETLGSWDRISLLEVVSQASLSPDVLIHLLRAHRQSPEVVSAICDHPALPGAELESLATRPDGAVLRAMMQSARVRANGRLLTLMAANPLADVLREELEQWLPRAQQAEAEEAASAYIKHHASDLARDDLQPFELVAASEGEDDTLDELLKRAKAGDPSIAPEEVEQLSLLQRIGRMRVGERIKLAMRGNREERMVLIRDRSKLVSLAVLESPKVTETEMEGFAAMKNVQEAVLRAISTKRNYIKNYSVLRALVNNPKTPLDVALPLVAHLLIKDQRALAVNKNVNETVRKVAVRNYRIKTEKKRD